MCNFSFIVRDQGTMTSYLTEIIWIAFKLSMRRIFNDTDKIFLALWAGIFFLKKEKQVANRERNRIIKGTEPSIL